MADIVYIYANNQTGQEALGAIRQISSGLATLDRLDGLRANSTGASCLLYTSPSPRDRQKPRMPASA